MARIPRVRFQDAGPISGSVQQSSNGFLALAQHGVQALGAEAADQNAKIEARARQKADIDFMGAANEYERQLSEVQIPEGGEGYAELADGVFQNVFTGFQDNVPDHLQDEFGGRVQDLGLRLGQQAFRQQEAEAVSFSKFKLNEGLEGIEAEAARNPEAAAALKKRGVDLINGNADLTADERRRLSDALTEGLDETTEIARVKRDPAAAAAYAGTATASGLLREFEGFRETPYWDVNALRTGYGSDTVTHADGSVEAVTKDTVVSRAGAERDLARRAKAFEAGARKKVGEKAWDNLSPNARAALTSIAYNYGSVPDRILGAARSGDLFALASAVEGLGGDNDGVNRARRNKEAEVIRGGSAGLNSQSYSRVQSVATQVLREQAKQQESANAIVSAQLGVSVSRGDASYDDITSAREAGTITPARWEQLTEERDRLLEKQQRESSAIEQLAERLASGEKANPHSADDVSAVDKLDEPIVEQFEGDELVSARVSQTAETGVASRGFVDSIKQGIDSQDPRTFEAALAARDRAPGAFKRSGASGIDKSLDAFESAVDQGFTAQKAAVIASPSKEREERADLVGDAVKKEIKELEIDEVVDQFHTFLPFDTPDVSAHTEATIMRDFKEHYRQARIDGLPSDVARTQALKKLTDPVNGIYGASQFAGGTFSQADVGDGLFGKFRRNTAVGRSIFAITNATEDFLRGEDDLGERRGLMRLPPERAFPSINGSHDYIGESIKADLQSIEGYEGGTWSLMSDPVETDDAIKAQRRGAAILPRYRLIYEDADGVLQQTYWGMEAEEVTSLQQAGRAESVAQGEKNRAEAEMLRLRREEANSPEARAAEIRRREERLFNNGLNAPIQ